MYICHLLQASECIPLRSCFAKACVLQDFCALVNDIGEKARNRCLHCKQGSGLVRCKGCSVAAHPTCVGLVSRQQQVRQACCWCSDTTWKASATRMCKSRPFLATTDHSCIFVSAHLKQICSPQVVAWCLPAFCSMVCIVPHAVVMLWATPSGSIIHSFHLLVWATLVRPANIISTL